MTHQCKSQILFPDLKETYCQLQALLTWGNQRQEDLDKGTKAWEFLDCLPLFCSPCLHIWKLLRLFDCTSKTKTVIENYSTQCCDSAQVTAVSPGKKKKEKESSKQNFDLKCQFACFSREVREQCLSVCIFVEFVKRSVLEGDAQLISFAAFREGKMKTCTKCAFLYRFVVDVARSTLLCPRFQNFFAMCSHIVMLKSWTSDDWRCQPKWLAHNTPLRKYAICTGLYSENKSLAEMMNQLVLNELS